MTKPLLYDYWRSSASYRVRIALAIKRIEHDSLSIDLRAGAQGEPGYRARNPQGLVPMLEIDGLKLTQSLAIIDYLDAAFPDPPLLPADPGERAHVRSLALAIACDIHPLNNLRVLKYLKDPLAHEEPERDEWYRHWLREGLAPLEKMAAPHAGRFLFGDTPTLADICLVPQLYNARRFALPLDAYPTLLRADDEAAKLAAFANAHPDNFAP